jgi:hypothetical protein
MGMTLMVDRPEAPDNPPALELTTLDERHHGVTREIGAYFAQAAAICFSRFHTSPSIVRVTGCDRPDASYLVSWSAPTERVRDGWANDDDATRDGAYGIVLAAVERHLGLVALSRTPVGSGADYWIGPFEAFQNPIDGLIDYENAFRLEVSGVSYCGDESVLEGRVRQKIRQARMGKSSRPAITGVVAFSMLRVVFRSVE